MTTLNNDLPAVAVSSQDPIETAARKRSLRIAGVSLGATLITVLILFAAMALAPVDASAANTCTLTSTQPTTNWTDATKWSGCGGGYPGQTAAGDTASVSLGGGYTLNVDAVVNPVILQIGGSASSVPVQIPSGGTLTLESSSTATSNNTFTVASGGTMGTESGANITGFQGAVHVNGGTFNSAGTIAFTAGMFTYSGGSLTGSGTINISNSGIFDGAFGAMQISATTINVNLGGSLLYSSGANDLTLQNSASIVNGGTFTGTGFGTIHTDGSATSITNTGTFNKTASGLFIIEPAFNVGSSGVAITGGVLDIDSTGTSSGPWTMSAGTEVWFPTPFAGTYTWASGTSFSGGKVTIDGSGTIATSFAMTVNNTNLQVNGGIFSTPSTFTVTAPGTLKWTGGTLTGSGHTVISSGTTFDMTTESSPRSVSSHTIDNAGNATLSATSQPPSLDSGSTFNNNGTFDIQSDGSMLTNGIGTNWFNNFGTAKKTGGGSGFRFDVLYGQIAGTTDANSATSGSTIIINGGGAMTGGVMKATQSTNFVDFFNGTFSASSGGSFSGPGAIRVNGGTLNFLAPYTLPSLFNETAGSLGGSGTITIPNAAVFNWSGGSITASAGVSITIQSGGTMNADTTTSSLIYDTRSLLINSGGNFNWNNGANAIVFQSAPVANGGTFTVATSGGTLGNATGSLLNTGLFKHTGAGTLNITLPLTNSGGTVSEQGGALVFLATTSVTHTGTFDAQAGTFLDFGAGTHNLSSGSSFTGTGTFKIAGATLNANTAVSPANLILFAGTLGGTANLTTTSSLIWTGGSMTGSGTTIAASGTAQLNTGSLTLARNLTLSVNTTYGGGLFVQNGVTITNNGTFDIQSTGIGCSCSPASTFVNNGTLRKSGSLVPVVVSILVSGTGALDVTGGWLQLMSNAAFGSASIASGAIAQFSGTTNSIGGNVSGGGTLLNIGGSTTVSGTVNLPAPGSIEVQPGTLLTLNGTTTTNTLFLSGGTTTGTGNITAGTFAWNGGSLTGTGSLTVSATLVIQGSTGPMTLSRNLINNAPTGIYDPPNATNILSVSPGVTITNNGTLEIQRGIAALAGSPVPSFANMAAGFLFRAAGTAGTQAFDPALTNAGVASFTFGTTTFTNGFTQTAGVTAFTSPISSPTGFTFTGGYVDGASTLTGDVSNGGSATFTPGNGVTPGIFAIAGNYTQTSGGTLTVNINGTTAGTQYGQLAVNGNVTLAGTLTVINPLGYTPNDGDTYNVLTFTGTRTNDFGTKNFPSPGPGGFLTSSYVSGPPAALAVKAVMQPADISAAQSGPVGVFQGQNATIVITITNAGPGPANNVTLTDTFSGGAFVSATPSSGSCSGTGPISCNVGTIAGSSSATVTLVLNANAVGTITNNASVSTTSTESNTGNNSASPINIAVTASADLSITKSGPVSAAAGFPIVYTITVTNNGPSDASAVSVNDPTPSGTTFVSNSGACTTPFPCSLGIVTAGQTKSITATFTTPSTFTGTSIANTATVTSTTPDPSAGNNSATVTTPFGPPNADLVLVKSGPGSAAPGSTVVYTLTIVNNGPATALNVSVADPTPAGLSFVSNSGGCTSAFPCSLGTLTSGQSATITATYTVTASSGAVINTAIVSTTSPDPNSSNDSSNVTTQIGVNACGSQPPTLLSPANGATVTSPVTFSWSAVSGASSYKLFATIGGASTQEIGSTSGTTLTLPVGSGSVVWFVQALGIANCTQLVSANGTFNVCGSTPVISVVGTSSAGQSYTVQWSDSGVASYELQESATEAFDNPQTFQVSGTSKAFTKSAVTPTPFFYRVRALAACGQGPGPYSSTERVVIVPIPPISSQGPSATVDINNKHVVVQTVFIPGQGSALPFAATTDEPWLTVTPNAGVLPADGITLTVTADPADLPNGTFTATIIVTFPGAAKAGTLDTHPPVTVPVSVSVVTPVSPTNLSTPSANSLIIPSVGHLDGINSQWRSDVRITNTSIQKINYLLRFTPAGGDPTQIKQTQVSIAANDTMALDDIVKNWYGVGALGDAANGVLEIRPLNTSGKGSPIADDVNVSFATIASSRTFNQSTGGTLGQYIPAIPFANFIGNVSGDARAGILSLQQIAQSSAYRTNLGIVEASGKPVSVLVSVFDTTGKNLLDIPIDLKAGEQRQLNSFLAAQNIVLADGRVEVKVTAGDGKVMAYASVVDNKTTDPLLVTGVPIVQTPARSFVLPGVADLSTGGANWRSDLRLFNAGADPQYVTMTLYPQTGSASSDTIARSFTVNPGEVSVLDNVLASRFGVTNIGGAMHVDTLTDANLVLTGRTYNQVDGGGTYGQYIAAVTPADGVGKGGRTLNVLQVEDSTRYRTNLGIAEVSGKPVTVEVSVFLPDAKVAPKVTIPLAANEYRQFRVLQQLGVGTAYNARVAIRVIDGDGRITAYGSVIDMQTQDPTYVPAQ